MADVLCTVLVEVSGGIVQAVYTDAVRPPVRVVVRDFDNIKAGDVDPLSGESPDSFGLFEVEPCSLLADPGVPRG